MNLGPKDEGAPRGVIDRRCFLEALLALGGVAAGCSSTGGHGAAADAGAAGAAGASDAVPFGIWRSLRDAVRQSPDHLAQVAQGLVQKADPVALFEFVRDQVATCPPIGSFSTVTGVRWGAKAALRSGMGTPREKAELLASLYGQAGLTASVVSGALDVPSDPTASVYTQQVTRAFAPNVDDATLAQWLTQMGASATVDPIDADDSERQALAAAVTALLPASTSASLDGVLPVPGAGLALGEVPLVAVEVNGQTTYANPILPTAMFGTSYTGSASTAPVADPPLPVTVELFASSTTAPATRTSVAKASFAADEVVGNQVSVQFVPTVSDLDQLAGLRVEDLHAFRSVISLRGPNIDDATLASKLVVGSTVTLRGDIVSTLPDGTVTLNGQAVVGAGPSTDGGNLSQVATLGITSVSGAAYANITVTVTALDAQGKPVLGLPAAAFQVAEQGTPMGFVETGSPMQSASVNLVVDVDVPLGNGDDPLDLASQITAQVVAAGGNVIVISRGVASGPLTSTDEVIAALGGRAELFVSGSLSDDDDCWPDLAAAAGTGAALTIYVSDYAGFDGADGAPYQNIAYAGPPVVAIGVPADGASQSIASPEILAVVAATGGQSLPNAGITDTLAALTQSLTTRGTTYTLTYRAPSIGPTERTVTVGTSNSKLSASGMYSVPTSTSSTGAQTPLGLAGLYLAVTVGTRTVTRVLAGYPYAVQPSSDNPLTQAHIDAVQGAMFGGTILSFEGAAPTFSAWVDDFLTSKLAIQPLWDAVVANDVDAIKAARGVTRFYIPPELALLQCSLAQGANTLTYQSGLRVVACTEQLQIGTGRVRKLDVLSLPGWLTFATDAATSFTLTLARSARAAVVETHVLDSYGSAAVTAASLLAGQALQFLDAGSSSAGEFPNVPEADQRAAYDLLNGYQDFYKLVPTQGPITAFWAVHSGTGTLLGVLADGSGGSAASSACSDFNSTSNALDVLGLVGDLGIYGVIGKTIAAIFTATAIILDGASDPNFTYDPDKLIKDIEGNLAWTAVTGAALEHLGGEGASKLDTVSGLLGGPSSGDLYPGDKPLAALGCG